MTDAQTPGSYHPDDSLRWWPSALALAIFAAGVVLVMNYHWRKGSVLMGGAAIVAAGLRLILPHSVAGVLAVRRRSVDVAILVVMGVGMMVLGMLVPGVYI